MRSPTGPWRRMLAGLGLTAAALLLVQLLGTGSASAEGGSGATSSVVGRGDIITSIIGWHSGGGGRGGPRPECVWRTATDAQIEWLVALSAVRGGAGGGNPVLDTVREHLLAPELPDGDIQAQICGGEVAGLRFVPRTGPVGTSQILYRRMITRLPAPEPIWSPVGAVHVPLRQPVFVSIAEPAWTPIDNTITVDGLTAEVRARPVALRVISGDPNGPILECDGRGREFDPGSSATVRAQAAHPEACTFDYRTASDGRLETSRWGPGLRPTTWIGTVTVVWEAEWRIDAGPWMSLGVIPRTRIFDRVAREVHTSIETLRG